MPQKRFNIALSAELEQYFREKAEVSGQSMASVIGLALGEYYQERKMLEKAKPEMEKIQAQLKAFTDMFSSANININNPAQLDSNQ